MTVSKKTMEELAQVCRLRLTDEELALYAHDLGALEEMVQVLLAVSPTAEEDSGAQGLSQMRRDRVKPSMDKETVLTAASVHSDTYIKVPRTVEEQ